MRKRDWILLIFFFLSYFAPGKINLKPTGFVNDFAGLLTQEERDSLETSLRELEKQTTVEIAVVIVEGLEGRNLEGYANEIFNTWGIGKKGKDNGVLIFIAIKERKIRIEVGYGMEHILTDGRCGEIIRNIISPKFKENNYYDGLSGAIETIQKLIEGKDISEVLSQKDKEPPALFFVLCQVFCLLFALAIMRLLGFLIQLSITIITDIIAGVSYIINPVYSEIAILLVFFIPFFFLIFLLPLFSIIFQKILKRRLKKYYGSDWKKHWPTKLIGSYLSGFSSSGVGFFKGGGGGFGGGSSGGGGASGGW
ncbi:MAG: TPM domain-containing protein [Candidatus Omnitrophica bacterium]|nr:TPM domain-containing protein [Candidatus Omnitrophota bacterium]